MTLRSAAIEQAEARWPEIQHRGGYELGVEAGVDAALRLLHEHVQQLPARTYDENEAMWYATAISDVLAMLGEDAPAKPITSAEFHDCGILPRAAPPEDAAPMPYEAWVASQGGDPDGYPDEDADA